MRFCYLLFLGLLCGNALAARVESHDVILLQPEEVIASRVTGAETTAKFVNAMMQTLEGIDPARFGAPSGGFVAVAVRPGGRSRIWLDLVPAPADAPSIVAALEALPAFDESEGTVVFAIRITVDGGTLPEEMLPAPTSWREAASRMDEPADVETIVAHAWPLEGPLMQQAIEPVAYVSERLVPLDGEIDRPKDWHFTRVDQGETLSWVISKEDFAKDGDYDTGVRLQVFIGAKEQTGIPTEQLLRGFLERQRAGAQEFEYCGEEIQGGFERLCARSVEGKYRVLYSAFWGVDELDVGILSVSGAPREEWHRYTGIFDRMSRFTLLSGKPTEGKTNEGAGRE